MRTPACGRKASWHHSSCFKSSEPSPSLLEGFCAVYACNVDALSFLPRLAQLPGGNQTRLILH